MSWDILGLDPVSLMNCLSTNSTADWGLIRSSWIVKRLVRRVKVLPTWESNSLRWYTRSTWFATKIPRVEISRTVFALWTGLWHKRESCSDANKHKKIQKNNCWSIFSSVGKIASSWDLKTNLSRTIMKRNKNISGNDTDNKLRNWFQPDVFKSNPRQMWLGKWSNCQQTSQGSAKILSLIEWSLNEKSGEMKK